MKIFLKPFQWFLKTALIKKIIVLVIIGASVWFIFTKFQSQTQSEQYQTAQVERGTLIVSVSASGTVSAANSAAVSTQATGVVSQLYVENGVTVAAGDPIAEIDLDLSGQQKSAQALASYQSAKNTLESTKANLFSLQSTMFTKWGAYMDSAQSTTYQNPDGSPNTSSRQLPQFMSQNDDWLAAEANYKNQQNVVAQAQTALGSSWLSYQQSSPTIYAPISGKVTGLSLQLGTVIASQATSSSTSTTTTGQTVANILTEAYPAISLNLTEIDVPKVKVGNKATITLDAFPDKTFTGRVTSVDTVGSVSSGVTTYPTTITLDTKNPEILSNMSATANIITETKDNVLLVPSSAVQTQNGETYVRVLKNGQPQEVTVQTGLSSDTQTEITSGLKEGDTIVTSIISSASSQGTSSQSPFSIFGGGARRTGGAGGFGR